MTIIKKRTPKMRPLKSTKARTTDKQKQNRAADRLRRIDKTREYHEKLKTQNSKGNENIG